MGKLKNQNVAPSPAEVSEPPAFDPHSISGVTARLARWGRIAPKGMALVEFESSLARDAAIAKLQERVTADNLPFHTIELTPNTPAEDQVRFLMETLPTLEPGVVSITGFRRAFPENVPLSESLRTLNYNRENLVNFPHRQIWWIPSDMVSAFDLSAWELARYFLVRTHLTEVIHPVAGDILPERMPEGPFLSPPEAERASQYHKKRFERALEREIPLQEMVTLAVESFKPLLSIGLVQEAGVLWNDLCKIMKSSGYAINDYLFGIPPVESLGIRDAYNTGELGRLYESQGQYDNAEALLIRSLGISENVFGTYHRETAASLNNLAHMYSTQRLYERAEPLYVRSLDICENLLGLNNQGTIAALNNLASLYRNQGQYKKAEELYVRALDHVHSLFGNITSEETSINNNLAILYEEQGENEKAEDLYVRALNARKKAFGINNRDTATAFNNLGVFYANQKRWDEAEELLTRALMARENVLGEMHPDTQRTKRSLENIRKAQSQSVAKRG